MQAAHIHRGYVSECVWARSKMSAHVLFMLSEEAIAAALTMSAANHLTGDRIDFGVPCTVADPNNGALPHLALRMGIASSGCDALRPDERTGRLVHPPPPPPPLSQHLRAAIAVRVWAWFNTRLVLAAVQDNGSFQAWRRCAGISAWNAWRKSSTLTRPPVSLRRRHHIGRWRVHTCAPAQACVCLGSALPVAPAQARPSSTYMMPQTVSLICSPAPHTRPETDRHTPLAGDTVSGCPGSFIC